MLARIGVAGSAPEAVRGAMEAVREAFEWDYAASWMRLGEELEWSHDSGEASDEFRRVTHGYRYGRGGGLSELVLRRRELLVMDDLGAVAWRSPRRHGAHGRHQLGRLLSFLVAGELVGVIEVWSKRKGGLSDARLEALRGVAIAVSAALERLKTRRLCRLACATSPGSSRRFRARCVPPRPSRVPRRKSLPAPWARSRPP